MRGGSNKKPIEEHLKSGNYRPSRHGIEPPETDKEKLEQMKAALFDAFTETQIKLSDETIKTNPSLYKMWNDVLIDQVKAFFSIAKVPIVSGEKKKQDKIDINEFTK